MMMANGLAENKELSKSIEENEIKEVTSKENNEEVASDNIIVNSPLDYDEAEKVEGNIFLLIFLRPKVPCAKAKKPKKNMYKICDYFQL